MEKYVQPYERMLEGDKNALSGVLHNSISKDNMEVFLTAIGRYKLEMLNDYNPVYEEDLKFCESIMKDIVHQYIYESEIYQRMMEGREVAQMQDNDENEVEEEQNGLTMRIRGD